MEQLWERVRAGRHTAVLGASPADPPPAAGVRVVRVRCDGPPSTLGPLHEARRKVEVLLGSAPPLFGDARDRVVQGLRRRLLGDVPAVEIERAVVDVLNRLARSSDRPAALLLDAVDAADEATLAVLRRILGRPGWLKLPLVLAFRGEEPAGPAAALLITLEAASGPDGILRTASEREAPRPPMAPPPPDWRALPPDVLRVLRAGALVGSGFEAELVAGLIDADLIFVLDALQRASDLGVPVEDLGEARFHLPEPMLDALRASTLPSLMIAWHQRLADLLGTFDEAAAEIEEPTARASAPPPATASVSPLAAEPASTPPTERRAGDAPGPWPYAEIFAPASSAAASASPAIRGVWVAPAAALSDEGEASIRPRAAEAPPNVAGREPPGAARADDARAAAHLAAAGDLDASAERYHAAARQAAEIGAWPQALACAEKVLAVLDQLPAAPRRRRLRVRTLVEVGRIKWHAAGPSAVIGAPAAEPGFTLASAMEALEGARAALLEGDPPELEAEVATAIAGVCYDLGDQASLTRALDELTAASRLLLEAGDAVGAARLLNDQAAVYVRVGDPVRATHLLTESRRIFEERAADDPAAALEMAETDHLLARIPLHVAARPGRESDALTMGLDHAIAAERTYHRLDQKRELARVWETMGRLELRKGRLDRARARLTAAVEAEESLGDLVGLARSTAALSELLAAGGRVEDALAVLSDSIELNLEKGSPIGLAFNRRALAALERLSGDDARPAVAETHARLEAAERILGALRLPGERD